MLVSTKNAIIAAGYKVFGSLVMVNGELFPLPLVQGNDKLGRRVWHSSTLPTCEEITITTPTGEKVTTVGTCPGTCDDCYATKGHYNDPGVMYLLHMRTRLLREYPAVYFLLVRIQLENEKIDRFRIHAAGDFIPGEAAGFIEVLKDFPTLKVWTYTKCKMAGEIAALNALQNVNIVKSVIAGCGFNFGHIEYIAAVFYLLKRLGKKVHICRCGIDPEQHCSDCDGCSDHEYVLFVEHSTNYNPKKSPFWEKFIQLVESQKDVREG